MFRQHFSFQRTYNIIHECICELSGDAKLLDLKDVFSRAIGRITSKQLNFGQVLIPS